jgi:hypothetical protein
MFTIAYWSIPIGQVWIGLLLGTVVVDSNSAAWGTIGACVFVAARWLVVAVCGTMLGRYRRQDFSTHARGILGEVSHELPVCILGILLVVSLLVFALGAVPAVPRPYGICFAEMIGSVVLFLFTCCLPGELRAEATGRVAAGRS